MRGGSSSAITAQPTSSDVMRNQAARMWPLSGKYRYSELRARPTPGDVTEADVADATLVEQTIAA
jgi:hypothetical protein